MATLKDLLDSGMSRDEINALLSQSTVGTEGFQQSGFMGGEPYMPSPPAAPMPQNYIQNERTGRVMDMGQSQPSGPAMDYSMPIEIGGYGKGYRLKGDATRAVLADGRIVDMGRDTGEERKRRLADAEIAKREAEVRQLNAKPQDTDIQKQINLMRMYESIPDPKMKQAFGEKHGFAGKPLVEEKPMTAEQRAKFEEGFANDYQTVAQTIETMSNIKNSIADIKGSKGLGAREGLTGYISPILQGEDARIADNRIATLKGKVTQMGKAMASMAGAIGPMAVQEWKIVSDAVNTIDPTAGNFKEQLANIENQADGAINRIKDKYERQYVDRFEKYPQFKREGDGTKPPSSPPQKPANNPTDDAGYEAWKKRNGKS